MRSSIKNSSNTCKAIVGIDTSQLYPFPMTKELPTGPYTKWELKKDNPFHPNKLRRSQFEKLALELLQSKRRECCIQTQFNAKQKKFDRFAIDGFCSYCSTVFEAMGCFHHFCHCQVKRRLSSEDIEKSETSTVWCFPRRFPRSQGLNIVKFGSVSGGKWEIKQRRSYRFHEKNHHFVPPLSESNLNQQIRQ